VVLLELEGGDNPLAAVPAFAEFQENLKKWMAEPPTVDQMTSSGHTGCSKRQRLAKARAGGGHPGQ
jgi:hypothetical protein